MGRLVALIALCAACGPPKVPNCEVLCGAVEPRCPPGTACDDVSGRCAHLPFAQGFCAGFLDGASFDGMVTPPNCGNGTCEQTDCQNCPEECTSTPFTCCGNGTCDVGIDCVFCPPPAYTDCTDAQCSTCDDQCDVPADCAQCPATCEPTQCPCNDICETPADCATCPMDCTNDECTDPCIDPGCQVPFDCTMCPSQCSPTECPCDGSCSMDTDCSACPNDCPGMCPCASCDGICTLGDCGTPCASCDCSGSCVDCACVASDCLTCPWQCGAGSAGMCTPGDGGGGPPDAMEIRDGACVSLDGAALAAPGCP